LQTWPVIVLWYFYCTFVYKYGHIHVQEHVDKRVSIPLRRNVLFSLKMFIKSCNLTKIETIGRKLIIWYYLCLQFLKKYTIYNLSTCAHFSSNSTIFWGSQICLFIRLNHVRHTILALSIRTIFRLSKNSIKSIKLKYKHVGQKQH